MHVLIACFIWPRWRLMSSVYGHLANRWLAPAAFCTGHGPLQFPDEVWRASRAFYTQLTPTPRLHILTVTQICTHWRTYTHTWTHICTQISIYWHKPTLNWTHIIIALSFSLLCSTMILECTLALLSFTFCLHWTEYMYKLEEKKDTKLTLPDFHISLGLL